MNKNLKFFFLIFLNLVFVFCAKSNDSSTRSGTVASNGSKAENANPANSNEATTPVASSTVTPDPIFGLNGLVQIQNSTRGIDAITRQADGKILTVGTTTMDNMLELYRFLPNGEVDATFGTKGRASLMNGEPYLQTPIAILLDGANNIYVICEAYVNNFGQWAVLKVSASGQVDLSYGTNGLVSFAMGTQNVNYPAAGAVSANGEVFMAGVANMAPAGQTADYQATIIKLKPNGSLDQNFANNGTLKQVANAGPLDLAVQTNGKIVLMYTDLSVGAILRRFQSDGSQDASFGSSGKYLISFGPSVASSPRKIKVSSDAIFIAGQILYFNGTGSNMAIQKLSSEGNILSSGFGNSSGVAVVDFKPQDTPFSMQVAADSSVFVSGESYEPSTMTWTLTAAKFTAAGVVDESFAEKGKFSLTRPTPGDHFNAGFVLPGTNRMIIAGRLNGLSTLKEIK